MRSTPKYIAGLAALSLAVGLLQVSRVVEILSGHQPTTVADAALGSVVAALIGMAAAGRTWHNGE